jgi:hypothetical protein
MKERDRQKERDSHNLEREESNRGRVGLTLKLDKLL